MKKTIIILTLLAIFACSNTENYTQITLQELQTMYSTHTTNHTLYFGSDSSYHYFGQSNLKGTQKYKMKKQELELPFEFSLLEKRNPLLLLDVSFGEILYNNGQVTKKREEIAQITCICECGGKGMGTTILTITADSILYERREGYYGNKGSAQYNILTSKELWSQLQTACDLTAFAKIESGHSEKEYDGCDETFTILTTEKTLSFMNGSGENYDKIKDFLDIIKKTNFKIISQ